jgi:uncharacterized membrane protein YjfL (UPF0719 family)
MSKKSEGSGGRLVTTLATTGGLMVLRKVLAAAWTKITGKNPPTDLTDPKVTLPEALAWGVATALVLETVRFGIVRATMRKPAQESDT